MIFHTYPMKERTKSDGYISMCGLHGGFNKLATPVVGWFQGKSIYKWMRTRGTPTSEPLETHPKPSPQLPRFSPDERWQAHMDLDGERDQSKWHLELHWTLPGSMVFGLYYAEPQVMTNIAMENHQFYWENSLSINGHRPYLCWITRGEIYIYIYVYIYIDTCVDIQP